MFRHLSPWGHCTYKPQHTHTLLSVMFLVADWWPKKFSEFIHLIALKAECLWWFCPKGLDCCCTLSIIWGLCFFKDLTGSRRVKMHFSVETWVSLYGVVRNMQIMGKRNCWWPELSQELERCLIKSRTCTTTVCVEDLSLVPSSHIRWLTPISSKSTSRGPLSSVGSWAHN